MAETSDLLLQGIQAARAGEDEKARKLLIQVVHADADNAHAWLWLSRVVADKQQRLDCLRQVLRVEPHNQSAQESLAELTGQKSPTQAMPAPAPTGKPTSAPAKGVVEDDLLAGVAMAFGPEDDDGFGGFSDADDDFGARLLDVAPPKTAAPAARPAPPASAASTARPRLITRPPEPLKLPDAPPTARLPEEELLVSSRPEEEEKKKGGFKSLFSRRKRKAEAAADAELQLTLPEEAPAEEPAEAPARRRFKLIETRALFGLLGLPVILGLLAYIFVWQPPDITLPEVAVVQEPTIGPECRAIDFTGFTPVTETAQSGGRLAFNTIFLSGQTYHIAGTLTVPQGRGLLIEPGARLLFAEGAALEVHGGLYVCGLARRPVILSAARETPGAWAGVRLRHPTADTVLSYVNIAYAGDRALYLEGRPPALVNVTITESRLFPISVDGNALPTFNKVEIGNNPVKGIEVRPGTLTAAQSIWPADFVYVVTGPLRVADTATLDIAPGAVVKFWQTGSGQPPGLWVEGLLKAERVTFTSLHDVRAEAGGVTYLEARDAQPGDWAGLTFSGSSERSYLRQSFVAYAGQRQAAITLRASSPEVISVTVTSGASYPMSVDMDSFPTLRNLAFVNNTPGNALEVRGGVISGRETRKWEYITAPEGQVVRVVRGVIVVGPEATLTIDAGMVIKFEARGKLVVQGTLNAVGGGTAASKIVFTSLRDDAHGGATGRGSSPQDVLTWGGIVLDGADKNTLLQNCTLRYAPLWVLDGAPRINNIDIVNSERAALTITPNATPELRAVNLAGNAFNGMAVLGGVITQDHVWPLLGEREAQVVRILHDNVTVAEGVTLRIAAGTVVKAGGGGRLTVLGGLRAPGEVHLPIIFTSLKDSEVGGVTMRGLTEALAGDWYGLILGPQADARLSHTNIHYARYGLTLRDGVIPSIPEGRLVISLGQRALWCNARSVLPEALMIVNNQVNDVRCPTQ